MFLVFVKKEMFPTLFTSLMTDIRPRYERETADSATKPSIQSS